MTNIRIQELEVGDRIFVPDHENGLSGTIVVKDTADVGVSFDNWHDGHNLDGSITDCSGWWLYNDHLVYELCEDYKGIDSEIFENLF